MPETGTGPVSDSTSSAPPGMVNVHPLTAIGPIRAGDDLAAIIMSALVTTRTALHVGDVLVISSKIVSKAHGLIHSITRDQVIAADTRRVVAQRRTPRGVSSIIQSAAGPVLAAAGVDASNTTPGTVLSLPADPDGHAAAIRRGLRAAGAPRIGVVISDTAGRPWRSGQSDIAIGAAGIITVDDLRGSLDSNGIPLEVTERAVADELAAAADLVKGKTWQVPVALIRGLGRYVIDDDGPGAAVLLRDLRNDWFRLGHVEAVRAALSGGFGEWSRGDVIDPPSVLPEPLQDRASRAVEIARNTQPVAVNTQISSHPTGQQTSRDASQGTRAATEQPLTLVITGDPFWCGVLVQRVLAALWSEDLAGVLQLNDAGGSFSSAGSLTYRITVTDGVPDTEHAQY